MCLDVVAGDEQERVVMQQAGFPRSAPDEYVQFWSTGSRAKGEFNCSECGYGVTIHRELPRCPMCGGGAWEQVDWSPFTRERRRATQTQPL
jgi:rubredoxin